MATLHDIDSCALNAWESALCQRLKGCSSLEDVAQRTVQSVYGSFRESVALVRLYAAIPFKRLPESNRRFVASLAGSHGVSGLLREETAVLSLLGTTGEKKEWNSRHTSKQHVGIPLISEDFIATIPMIARLLQELGVAWGDVQSDKAGVETSTFGKLGGLFYVEDASTAVDHAGRKIITAQDFVRAHGIKTVFGTAGRYVLTRTFITLIVFARESISREAARQFMPLGNTITGATSDVVNRGKLFVQ